MKYFLCILAVGLVSFRLSTAPRNALADGGCSVKSLNGPYSFSFSLNGFYTVNGNTGFEVGLGRMLFDGTGNLSGIETGSADGTIVQNLSIAGKYTINPDCTGSASFLTTPGNSQDTVSLVVAANATVVQFISTVSGFAAAGTAYQIGSPPQ
jgi:hypothetical protein